jgi:hypothetical protein
MKNQHSPEEQEARRQKQVAGYMKKHRNKIFELQLIDGKPQMVCSLCGGTSFSFCTGLVWFIISITTFYRICNTCGKKSRHGGKAS